jgi:hypothetical protein
VRKRCLRSHTRQSRAQEVGRRAEQPRTVLDQYVQALSYQEIVIQDYQPERHGEDVVARSYPKEVAQAFLEDERI